MLVGFVAANNLGTYRSAKVVAESLGIGLLGAVVSEYGDKAILVDARLYDYTPKEAARLIEGCELVGITMLSFESLNWIKKFVRFCKEENPDRPILVGGYYPTLYPEKILECLQEVDMIILGEGEKTIIEVIEHQKGKTNWEDIDGIIYRTQGTFCRTKKRDLNMELDSNPFPKRYAHEFADENFEILIEAGRGCMNNCTFCAVKPFFKNEKNIQWRGRSAQSIIEEIKYLREQYPRVHRIRFVDPDFLGSDEKGLARAEEFCDLLEKEEINGYKFYIETRSRTVKKENRDLFLKLKDVGVVEIYLGFESGSKYILTTMNKGIIPEDSINAASLLREWGIDFVYGFMMFTPWSRYKDIELNIKFLTQIGDIQFDKLFHSLDLIPGTPSVLFARNKGLLGNLNSRGYYDFKYEFDEVARLTLIWPYLQKYHMDFLQNIWYLYKDLKNWKQTVPCYAERYLAELSIFSLNTFNKLCSYTKDRWINQEVRDSYIDALIEMGAEEINKIENHVDRRFCFPRNKMSGGA